MNPRRSIEIRAVVLGAALLGASLAQADPATKVYIPTGDSAEVLVIDPGTSTVIGEIAGLPAAHGLAVTPDGRRLIVGSFEEREPGAAMPEKPEGVSAVDHAAHHAAKPEAEAQPMVSSVSIVDTATGTVTRKIDVPGAVHHVAASPDGQLAAVTHPNSDAVTVIDLDGLAAIKTVETGSLPNYAAFSRDSMTLYVSNAGEDTIAVVDRSTWSLSGRIATGTSPEHLVLSPDGDTLYVNNVDDGSVSVVDLPASRAVDTLPVGDSLHGIDLSDDGGTLFVADRGGERLMAIDLGDGSRRSVAMSPSPYHLGVIRGAGVLYVSSAEEPVLTVVDATTLETTATISLSGIGHQLAQSSGD